MAKFSVGQRVILPANDENPEERGVVIEVEDQTKYPGMYIVELDPEYGDEEDDDGIREIHEDSMKPE